MDASARLRLKLGLILTQNGESWFLTDLDSGEIFELNKTAVEIYQHLHDGPTLDDLVAFVQKNYPEIPRGEIKRDLMEVLTDFVKKSLIEVVN